jgi:hypothetical protein
MSFNSQFLGVMETQFQSFNFTEIFVVGDVEQCLSLVLLEMYYYRMVKMYWDIFKKM